MQDQLYTRALKEVRKDVGQAFDDTRLLPNIPSASEWKKNYAYAETHALILVSFHSDPFDIGEWNKAPVETVIQGPSDQDASLDWVADNADDLYEKYPSLWILVDKSSVIESAANPQDLMRLAKEQGNQGSPDYDHDSTGVVS